jgi:malyl-CoA/(S)-citramalyl-CoA lyase
MAAGTMQDDATWNQTKMVVDLARIVARKDKEMGAKYGL